MSKKRVEVSQEHEKKHNLEEKLIQNLIELQKVHTNLAEKFDNLSKQISSLLILFESAAKSFVGNQTLQEGQKDKEFLEKINKLLDQNKTIAKGLTLMEERIRERVYGSPQQKAMSREFISEDDFRQGISGRPLPRA